MSDNSTTANGGAGFASLLTIAFIVLKLCKVITWSWWWVVSPIWIPLGLIIAGFAIYLSYILIKNRRRPRLRKVERSKWQIRIEEMQEKQRAAK